MFAVWRRLLISVQPASWIMIPAGGVAGNGEGLHCQTYLFANMTQIPRHGDELLGIFTLAFNNYNIRIS